MLLAHHSAHVAHLQHFWLSGSIGASARDPRRHCLLSVCEIRHGGRLSVVWSLLALFLSLVAAPRSFAGLESAFYSLRTSPSSIQHPCMFRCLLLVCTAPPSCSRHGSRKWAPSGRVRPTFLVALPCSDSHSRKALPGHCFFGAGRDGLRPFFLSVSSLLVTNKEATEESSTERRLRLYITG